MKKRCVDCYYRKYGMCWNPRNKVLGPMPRCWKCRTTEKGGCGIKAKWFKKKIGNG